MNLIKPTPDNSQKEEQPSTQLLPTLPSANPILEPSVEVAVAAVPTSISEDKPAANVFPVTEPPPLLLTRFRPWLLVHLLNAQEVGHWSLHWRCQKSVLIVHDQIRGQEAQTLDLRVKGILLWIWGTGSLRWTLYHSTVFFAANRFFLLVSYKKF